jgi:hypothetical protein
MKSPPKHEKNVLLQSLVKYIEADKIRKGSDYGVIASVMKERQDQYSWLKHGMLYHLMTTLDGVIKEITLHMGCYPIGRQASTFKNHSINKMQSHTWNGLMRPLFMSCSEPEPATKTSRHQLTQSSHLRPSDAWV